MTEIDEFESQSATAKGFIQQVLGCRLAKQDRIIAEELATLRTKFNNGDNDNFIENIKKLMFLNLRGCNTSFGQIPVIKLVSGTQYSHKRLGYIAASFLLDMTSDISILITQELQKDLKRPGKRVKMAAMQFLANVGDATICETVMSELLPIFQLNDCAMLKTATMCAVRCIQNYPDGLEEFKPFVARLVVHTDHGVAIAGVNLAKEINKHDVTAKEKWYSLIPTIIKALKSFQTGAEMKSCYIHRRFNDPFLQIAYLDFLSLCGQPSTDLDDLLTTIITSLSTQTQTGYSILHAAVNCVSHCANNDSIRALAVNQLGKILSTKNNSIIYAALSSLARTLFHSAIYDRDSPDSVAVQRYRDSIIQLLDHPDNSIRRRALDVILALVNSSNAKEVVPQMAGFLKSVDGDFRMEMVPKIFNVIQTFAPDDIWNFDNQLDIILRCDGYIGTSSIAQFTNLVMRRPEVQKHAIATLSNCLVAYPENQALCQVASFLVGELQDDPSVGDIETLLTISRMPQTTEETLCYIIIALAKLANRFGMQEKVAHDIVALGSTNSLEIQQRCGEFARILINENLRNQLLAKADVVMDRATAERAQAMKQAQQQQQQAPVQPEEVDLLSLGTPSAPSQPQQQQSSPEIDLLSLGNVPQPAQNAVPATNAVNAMLGAPAQPQGQPQQQQPQQQKSAINPPPNSVEACRTTDYVMFFEIAPVQNQPRLMIRVSIFGLGTKQLTNFHVQYGVPVGWTVHAQQPSSDVLEPFGSGRPIVQVIMAECRARTKLAMKAVVSYLYSAQPLKDQITMNPVFDRFGL